MAATSRHAVRPGWTIVLGLGSNLGDRLAALRQATGMLEQQSGLLLLGRSSIYETRPMGGPPQPDYLNAGLLLRAEIEPHELLRRALCVELALGRARPDPSRWGPRIIDIDLLWSPNTVLHDPALVLPHPRLAQRSFALAPLLELVPDACDPVTGQPYRALAQAMALAAAASDRL